MRVLCAPDKFKQACTASEAAEAMRKGVLDAAPEARVRTLPLADGGEGTLQVLSGKFPDLREAIAQDALGRNVRAVFALSPDGRVALIESAQACGLMRLKEYERNPLKTHTYGVGQLIRAAMDAGAQEILLGLGGSATSDGGLGMAAALGARFADAKGAELAWAGGTLYQLKTMDLSRMDARLSRVRIRTLCDVKVPMLGEQGDARDFILQKGGTTRTIQTILEGMQVLNERAREAGLAVRGDQPYTGAAGGLGFGAAAFLNAKLEAGSAVVTSLLGLAAVLRETDLVLSGEGTFDARTADGKLISALASACHTAHVPLVVLAGAAVAGVKLPGVTAAFGISTFGARKQDSLAGTLPNLRRAASSVAQLALAFRPNP
jgi:glycerate 2-kinase